ncbi:MAG: MarC family protein [Nitrospinae bacterium]|nr:MarC family protein [Nitrospinota bacterium]
MTEPLIFFVKSFVALFSVLDPFGAAITLLALAPGGGVAHRADQAFRAVRASAMVMLVFAIVGGHIFAFFGVSVEALMVAGGVILMSVSLKMLEGESITYRSSLAEREEGERKEDVAIIPMAVPILSGPAAITAVMVFANRAANWMDWVALLAALGLSLVGTWLILRNSERVAAWLGATGVRLLTRVMGLILIAMGVEFALSGVKSYFH